ncbi:Uncharacterised protein [Mycolicibacterium smegmatis]|nr:Uncharacterised protein [Mycolicibacterium smegmatis]
MVTRKLVREPTRIDRSTPDLLARGYRRCEDGAVGYREHHVGFTQAGLDGEIRRCNITVVVGISERAGSDYMPCQLGAFADPVNSLSVDKGDQVITEPLKDRMTVGLRLS